METKINWIEQSLLNAEEMIYDGNVSEGISLMEGMLYDEPGYGSLHNHLGWAYLYYGSNMAKAELHLSMSVKFNSSFPAPYLHLGALYFREARYSDAVRVLNQGVALKGANKFLFYSELGRSYELLGKLGQAINAYKEALMNTTEYESEGIIRSIKRCRRKRITTFFSF